MKRSTNPTPAQVAAACESQSLHDPELHRVWMVRFPGGRVVERRYQVGVSRSRVLSEHAGAVDAAPVIDDPAVFGPKQKKEQA